jgi:hypothetical protein
MRLVGAIKEVFDTMRMRGMEYLKFRVNYTFTPPLCLLGILQSWPDQPVARGQHGARDTVLCCPRRHLQ